MPKKIYCSACEQELRLTRKAFKAKGAIFDCVDPHECPGKPVEKGTSEKPSISDVLDGLDDLGKAISDATERSPHANLNIGALEDKRKEVITTTAPPNLLRSIKNQLPANTDIDGKLELE